MNQPTSTAPDTGATDALPTVVIVGRPNVGKSTLFNRIVGHQVAIVEDRPGVTRDRKEVEAEWLGTHFLLVDTGGWLPGGSELDEKVSRQVEAAVKAADVVLFVVDASVGLTDDDESVANWLRRIHAPVVVVANKADNDRRENEMWEFLGLGMGEPVPVSALHGRRAGDLLDVVVAQFPEGAGREPATSVDGIPVDEDGEQLWRPDDVPPPRVAIVGRPNVGKSTLFNRLVGEDRSVVHDMAGTTRDAIDTLVDTPDGPIVFVDTAGMRRRSRIDDSAEYYSMVRALRAIDDADIALLVIDATEGVTSQDQRLAERVDAAGCPIVVMLNKWELLDDAEQRADVTRELERKLYFMGDAPVLRISALTGKGVHKLRPVLQGAIEQYHRRVPTRDVNRVIAEAQQRQPAGHGLRVLYALQGATDPPTFTLFVNRELPAPYLRYLERSIREAFEFGSTPIKIRVRKRSE
ncbi:MAG: ribosome biogenesis GTPase Der [Acidimicrobiaceae bacterium]|nr:ribosome biogenesis GTPase Der [Acidimicrobiaceae bacterium]MCO5330267.1 ribosome biogenesis GTPase Der [Ilumatobacteraceae bacterium]